jgi:hypothetical protein
MLSAGRTRNNGVVFATARDVPEQERTAETLLASRGSEKGRIRKPPSPLREGAMGITITVTSSDIQNDDGTIQPLFVDWMKVCYTIHNPNGFNQGDRLAIDLPADTEIMSPERAGKAARPGFAMISTIRGPVPRAELPNQTSRTSRSALSPGRAQDARAT